MSSALMALNLKSLSIHADYRTKLNLNNRLLRSIYVLDVRPISDLHDIAVRVPHLLGSQYKEHVFIRYNGVRVTIDLTVPPLRVVNEFNVPNVDQCVSSGAEAPEQNLAWCHLESG